MSYRRPGSKRPRGKGKTNKKRGVMNATERRYADHLDEQVRLGIYDSWDYEPMSLKLAPRTHYVPDFRVLAADGTLEIHEVKGGFMHEKAWIKLKVAAALHPFVFRLIVYKGKAFTSTEVGDDVVPPKGSVRMDAEEEAA